MFALSRIPQAEGATFHLTAGTQSSSVGQVIELATRFFGHREPWLVDPSVYDRVVHPLLLRGAQDEQARLALERSQVYFPYFAMRVHFDDRRARVALRCAGIVSPPLESYFDRLLRFAIASKWGRRRITRATAMGHGAPAPRPAPAAQAHHPPGTPYPSPALVVE